MAIVFVGITVDLERIGWHPPAKWCAQLAGATCP
jgi:hypothetical protein